MMDPNIVQKLKTRNTLVVVASSIIIIAGIKAASSILIPILLAFFLAIITSPPFLWMSKKGIPKALSILTIIIVLLAVIFLFGLLIGTSIADFTSKLPQYQAKLETQVQMLTTYLIEKNIIEPDFKITEAINPGSILNIVGDTLNQVSSLFTDVFLIMFLVVFILLEAASIPIKLKIIFRHSNDKLSRIENIYSGINKYIGIKTIISIITGLLVYILLIFIGVDYPLLWGVLAFALNYIPNIGSIIAAVPPLLLTIIQLGFIEAVWILVGYLVINTIMGNIVEPKYMGSGLGLSTLVVFLSLIFWGWIMGPIGMLLSIPLTITIKIILDSSPETRWLAILLSSEKDYSK